MPDMQPITRKEMYLSAIADGVSSDLPKPITRKEKYLDAIANADADAELPAPITREEKYLHAVYDTVISGVGGGGSSGGVSLNDIDVFIGDYMNDDVDVNIGAIDVYQRVLVS